LLRSYAGPAGHGKDLFSKMTMGYAQRGCFFLFLKKSITVFGGGGGLHNKTSILQLCHKLVD